MGFRLRNVCFDISYFRCYDDNQIKIQIENLVVRRNCFIELATRLTQSFTKGASINYDLNVNNPTKRLFCQIIVWSSFLS